MSKDDPCPQEPEASTSRMTYNSGYVGREELVEHGAMNFPAVVTPGMKAVQDKVTQATTPLANLPYLDQVRRRRKEEGELLPAGGQEDEGDPVAGPAVRHRAGGRAPAVQAVD